MIDDDYEIKHSPLSQKIQKDGKVLDIQIYYSDEEPPKESGWILEIEDIYGNSTVYDTYYNTEMAALNQALDDIEKEGLDAFIGQPPSYLEKKFIQFLTSTFSKKSNKKTGQTKI